MASQQFLLSNAGADSIEFPAGTTSFTTATHTVYVIDSTTTMTVKGAPTFSIWCGGSGGGAYGGCVGHAGTGGGGAGGLVKVIDDTATVPKGEYNVVVPGRGGGNTYLENTATSTKYYEAIKGGFGTQNVGGAGGCGGGGGAQ